MRIKHSGVWVPLTNSLDWSPLCLALLTLEFQQAPSCGKSTATTLGANSSYGFGFERRTSLSRLSLCRRCVAPRERAGRGDTEHDGSAVRSVRLHVDVFSTWSKPSSRVHEAGESSEMLEKEVDGTGDLWTWQHEFGEWLIEPTAFDAWPLGSWAHYDSCNHLLSIPWVWFSLYRNYPSIFSGLIHCDRVLNIWFPWLPYKVWHF